MSLVIALYLEVNLWNPADELIHEQSEYVCVHVCVCMCVCVCVFMCVYVCVYAGADLGGQGGQCPPFKKFYLYVTATITA